MQQHLKQTTGGADSLQAAFAKLQDLQVTDQQVRRVSVERQGEIHLEVHQAGQHRFFVYEANELRELKLEDDSKVPLVSKLQNSQFVADHNIISYRPGRRIVLGPAGNRPGNIIKGYKKRRAAQAAENYAIALSACEAGGFDIPELLRFETGTDCLVMTLRPGQSPQINLDAIAVWTTIGSHLRRFQQSQVAEGLPEFGFQDEFAVLDERARRFLLCMPALPDKWQEGRDSLEKMTEELPATGKGLTHRDLHDGQFIVADKRVSLLDFDLICIADVALDAANLLVHMKLRALQGRSTVDSGALSVCSSAFLSGLGRQAEPGFKQQLLFYQATSYYRLALLYALRPRWMHLSEELIDLGDKCVHSFNDPQDNS